jgi:hypothetical protein
MKLKRRTTKIPEPIIEVILTFKWAEEGDVSVRRELSGKVLPTELFELRLKLVV